MQPKALLIDGFNLVRRIYEARPDSAANMPDVVRAATQSLERALKQHHPTHACVAFETHTPTWRHSLDAQYKANRKPTPTPLLEGLATFEHAFNVAGVRCFTLEGYETDDVIATFAQGIANADGTAIILSTDKAFLQFLCGNIRVFNHFDNMEVTGAEVEQRYGIAVHQLTDYWALVGDTTNNIKGVPKIGEKGAGKLLQRYSTLDAILAESKPDKLTARVQAHAQEARLSKILVTLKTDVALGINLRSFRLTPF